MKISILLFLFSLFFTSLGAAELQQSEAAICEEMKCCNSAEVEAKEEKQSATLSPYIGQHNR